MHHFYYYPVKSLLIFYRNLKKNNLFDKHLSKIKVAYCIKLYLVPLDLALFYQGKTTLDPLLFFDIEY